MDIPITEFFRMPTIRQLSGYIDGADRREFQPIPKAEPRDCYPLAGAQKRLYVLQQMDLRSTAYNEFLALPLVMDLDKEHLEPHVRRIIERHESLRTHFIIIDGEPFQKVAETVDFEVEYRDLGLPEGTPNDELMSHVKKATMAFTRPFDLTRSPLLRVGLVKTGKKRCILMVVMHHIITDGASMLIFLDEFMALIGGKDLPPLPVQYKDYAVWLQQPEQLESATAQRRFWLEQFPQEPPRLKLPFDFPRPAGIGKLGIEGFLLTGETASALMELARKEDATLFMIFLAIYNVLLFQVTGSSDIVIGTLTAGRIHPDLEQVIGMFVNTLALRNWPQPDQAFTSFLKEVKERTLAAFDNQGYQFDDLVEQVVKNRQMGRNPLFDAAFSYEAKQWHIAGVEQDESIEGDRSESEAPVKFDITLSVTNKKDSIDVGLAYNRGLFKKETIQRFVGYLQEICREVATNPGTALKEIKISHDLAAAQSNIADEDGDFGF